jgi:hypothetical protein
MSKTLNDWERNFMKSIDGRKRLSPKQRIVRDKIMLKMDDRIPSRRHIIHPSDYDTPRANYRAEYTEFSDDIDSIIFRDN